MTSAARTWPADVAAVLGAVEVDLFDRLVGLLLRHLDAVAQAHHAQHAAAVGGRVPPPSWVPAWKVTHSGRFGRDAVIRSPLRGLVRIAGGGHHHAHRRAAVPFQFHLVERAVDGVFHHGQQVALQARHDRLGFRVAHAAVEFQRARVALRVDHQAGVQEAGEGDAVLGHALDGRVDDLAHHARMHGRRDDRRRRVGAHAARVRALVVVLQALVVLAGGQRQDVLAVAHDDEAGFFAGQEFLDHDARAGVAEAVIGQHVSTAWCASSSVMATTTPLPAARPSALMTIGAPLASM
jgi:hypothetical protein